MKNAIVLAVVGVLGAGSAWAAPFVYGDGGAALQKVLDDITTAPVSGDSSVDVTMDGLADTQDSYWSVTGAGGSVTTMIIEIAGFASRNVFGVYSAATYVPLFAGSAMAGDSVVLQIKADGSVYVNFADTGKDFAGNLFGYFLDSTADQASGGGLFHSDTALNADSQDHMVAFQGTNTDTIQTPTNSPGLWTNNEYVLAFEDLRGPLGNVSDRDFTDMVVIVESVIPAIPEPTTMLLLGTGLVGLAGASRRRKS